MKSTHKSWLWRSLLIIFLLIAFYEFRPNQYAGLTCVDKKAATLGKWNFHYDGDYLGANGCPYDPKQTELAEVPPIKVGPPQGDEPFYYVNGANHRVKWALAENYVLARDLGRPVVGIYNGTLGGRFPDALLRGLFPGHVLDTLTELLWQHVSQGKPIHIRANSQGTIEMSHALQAVRDRLMRQQPPERVDELMDLIRFETAGSAIKDFPDGPRYVHYVNLKDPVPKAAGIMASGSHPGRGAVIACFDAYDEDPIENRYRWIDPLTQRFLAVHGFMVYRHYRRPFDELYAHNRRDGQLSYLHIKTPTDSRPNVTVAEAVSSCQGSSSR